MLPTESHRAPANDTAGSLVASLLSKMGGMVGMRGQLQKDGQIVGMDEGAVGRKFGVIFRSHILIFVQGMKGGAKVVGQCSLSAGV